MNIYLNQISKIPFSGEPIQNNLGSVTKQFKINNQIQYFYPMGMHRPPPPPPGGCPFLYVYSADSLKNTIDNNLLHRSENPEFANRDIEDKYLLTIKPALINNKISVGIMEPENDYSYFDQIKLYAIDHSIWDRVVVTENNDIAIYDMRIVISPDEAFRNVSEITPYIQYDTTHNSSSRLVTGVSNDSINAEYDKERILIANKNLRERIKGHSESENIVDSLAIIAEIGLNPNDAPTAYHVVKEYAGAMTIDANYDTYEKFFSRRENNSPVVIPFSNGLDAASNVGIKWFRNYELVYLSVVDIFYSGFTQTEIPLTSAFHSNEGDVLDKLQSIDHEYAELDSSSYLSFEFTNINPPAPGKIRDYVSVVTGQYTFGGDRKSNIQESNMSSRLNDLRSSHDKLIGNYPNPFNPITTICYEIANATNVKLRIYDVLGRQIHELVNEFKNVGNYEVTFDGMKFSSGIYYYKLETNESTFIKKMILIK